MKYTWAWINTLRPRQNGRLFADDTFKCILLNENIWITIKNSLKFVPKVPIINIPALVQIMAWHRPGDKPLSEPMLVSLPTHICVTRPQWVNKMSAQIAKTLRSMSIRYQYYMEVSDRYLIDLDPRIFAIWENIQILMPGNKCILVFRKCFLNRSLLGWCDICGKFMIGTEYAGNILMAWCKTAVTPVHLQWSFCSLALCRRCVLIFCFSHFQSISYHNNQLMTSTVGIIFQLGSLFCVSLTFKVLIVYVWIQSQVSR